MIPDSVLSQIQDRVDIVEVISAFVPLRRAGQNFKAPCPFHQEKTPSFMVSADKQIFYCFGCGVGGNVFSFLMKIEKKDFPEVVEALAERVGVEIPKDKTKTDISERAAVLMRANQLALEFYHKFLKEKKEAEKARAYLERRGISQATIDEFKIGYAGESWDAFSRAVKAQVGEAALEKAGLVILRKEAGGSYDRFRQRVIFPILDAKGACVAFGGRVLDDALPKYLNSPETEVYHKGRNLYGLYQARRAIREEDRVFVVEGYMDLVCCHQADVRNAVASLGTALTPDQARLLKRHTQNVVILYDADKAGEMATLRGLEVLLEEELEVKIVRLAQGHDPDSFIREFGVERFREAAGAAQTLLEYKLSILKGQFDVKTVEGKIKIANEMVALFAKVKNEIQKAAWLKELARELALSEEALLAELKKAGALRARMIHTPSVTAEAAQRDVFPSAEKLLVGLLLESADFVARARQEIRPEDFRHPAARRIVETLLKEAPAGAERLSAKTAVNYYRDDPQCAQVISLAAAEAETLVDKEKTFEDCLMWLVRSRIQARREGLRSEIVRAEQEGDRNRISELLSELSELNKGMKSTHEKK
ncbi:MAG: DNA primase [Candidatus Omnitrophica bacterium]|nr:DNA primase [Candidatus Omnitrophota bacterium]